MATTAAALLSAAGRRLWRSSASSIICREVSGRHRLTIDGCAPSTKLPRDWSATSKAFEAAGYTWQITYAPYGYGNSWRDKYISLQLVYGGHQRTDPLHFSFSLLDPAGDPVPAYTRSAELCWFDGESVRKHGFLDFIRWEDLQHSGCLRDDRFVVQCDITVVKDWAVSAAAEDVAAAVAAARARVAVPPSDLHEHLGSLLSKKHGADVAITVGGGGEATTYDAHAWLLAARSPVLEAELLATSSKDKSLGSGSVRRRRMEIHGVEPKVFEAMLHFLYTDALPEMAERDVVAMAQSLLAAAHRYELERLKLMCAEMLCKRIDVNTVAGTLVVAEHHGCRALKDACLEFMAVPGNLKQVMDTQGYEKMKANCPAVLLEFAMKRMQV
ncbi:BTB/POZ and MATH domain-containing protein 3 [Sorghum bicolor]|uniref:BTB/POZ and MATH domain-containing protein 3 n=1 Tax=Sorghum bicolor TaxID=4558 RepID=UPI00081AE6B0|nr:BTB/POZ and MATH domain-containing protein 3 [Sorghum bicolor]|eukprot:XP_002443354.2 BTB/POZ and MATH domain-containing protein 3 [Sorghum bicolor]